MNKEIILNVSSPQIATIHISLLITTIEKNKIIFLLFNVGFKHFISLELHIYNDISNDIITVDYIKSNDNFTDPFTKALAKDRV